MASKENQMFSRGVRGQWPIFEPEAADEMTGGQRHQTRVFIHLSEHFARPDGADPRVFNSRTSTPRSNAIHGYVRGIIIEIDQHIVTPPEF